MPFTTFVHFVKSPLSDSCSAKPCGDVVNTTHGQYFLPHQWNNRRYGHCWGAFSSPTGWSAKGLSGSILALVTPNTRSVAVITRDARRSSFSGTHPKVGCSRPILATRTYSRLGVRV